MTAETACHYVPWFQGAASSTLTGTGHLHEFDRTATAPVVAVSDRLLQMSYVEGQEIPVSTAVSDIL